MNIGPYLQHILYQPIEHGAPSIENVTQASGSLLLPTVGAWLNFLQYLPFFAITAAAASLSLRFRTPIPMALAIGSVIFSGVLISDIILMMIQESLSIAFIVKSVIANLLGAMIMTLITLVIFSIYKSTIRQLNHPGFGATAIVLFSVICSLIAYSMIFFTFQPVAVNYQVSAKPDIEGFYRAKRDESDPDGSNFQFIPTNIDKSSLRIESPEGTGKISLRRLDNGHNNIAVHLISDCFAYSSIDEINLADPVISEVNVTSLSIEWDDGLAGLEIPDLSGPKHDFIDEYPTFFWLNSDLMKGEPVETIGFSNFLSPNSTVMTSFRDEATIFLRLPLMIAGDGKSQPAPRDLYLRLGDRVEKITFESPPPLKATDGYVATDKIDCRNSVPTQTVNGYLVSGGRIGGGLLISVKSKGPNDGSYYSYENELKFSDLNGWGEVFGIDPAEITQHEIGYFSSISLLGELDIEIDGESIDTRPLTRFTVVGETFGSMSDGGRIKLSGRSDRIWLGQNFLNQSTWARLSTEFQIALLGWLGALLWLLIRPVQRVIKYSLRNEPVIEF